MKFNVLVFSWLSLPIYFVSSIIWSRVLTPVDFSICVSAADSCPSGVLFLPVAPGLGDFFPADDFSLSGLSVLPAVCVGGCD